VSIDRVYGLALNLIQGVAGHRVGVPRLQIAARCGICCTLDQPVHDIWVNVLIKEVPAGDARTDRIKDIHGFPLINDRRPDSAMDGFRAFSLS
jgi:hypothetical protein